MEYMRIDGFIGRAVSKLINKGIQSKVGFWPAVELQKCNLTTDEDDSYIQVDMTVCMSRGAFDKLIEEVTK